MFNFAKNDGPKPKCFVTNIKLSSFLNHEQPPTKKKPFSIILNQTYSHTLDIVLPSKAAQALQSNLSISKNDALIYARVQMKTLELITGDFFTTYIKTPNAASNNILMLSQSHNDTTLSLSSGQLCIETSKSIFQRLGLQGKPIPGEGRKHVKERYVVELDLRSPSMVSGKPGFERVKWAFKNVLDESVTWLVSGIQFDEGPVVELAPVIRKIEPEIGEMKGVLVPTFSSEVGEDDSAELLEWLSLAMAISPRILRDDNIDTYLSRYQVPDTHGDSRCQDLTRLRWRGLIPRDFAYKLFLAALKASGDDWVAVSATSFSGEMYTILVDDGHALSWEYKD